LASGIVIGRKPKGQFRGKILIRFFERHEAKEPGIDFVLRDFSRQEGSEYEKEAVPKVFA